MSEKGDKPNYVARARQEPDSEFTIVVGAAWQWKNGKEGITIKLYATPLKWDGSFILTPVEVVD